MIDIELSEELIDALQKWAYSHGFTPEDRAEDMYWALLKTAENSEHEDR